MTLVLIALAWQCVGAFVIGMAGEADWPKDNDKHKKRKYAFLLALLGPVYLPHMAAAWLGGKLMEYRLRAQRVVQVLRKERAPRDA